uniref:PRA1 family protein n=1 Tax=Felis catus TaxID=9685 RepID=A0ABI7ZT15_FELCA
MAAEKDPQKDAEPEGLSASTLLPKLIPSGAGREWLERRRATIRPWGSFVDQRRFSRPRNLGELCQRLVRNVEYYQSNYVFVFLGLILYCVVTSPMLLVALAVFFGACYILYLRTLQSKFVLFGVSWLRGMSGTHRAWRECLEHSHDPAATEARRPDLPLCREKPEIYNTM